MNSHFIATRLYLYLLMLFIYFVASHRLEIALFKYQYTVFGLLCVWCTNSKQKVCCRTASLFGLGLLKCLVAMDPIIL